MGLLDSKKDINKEDTLKVLSTNIEVINQRLAQTNPEYGFSEFSANIKKSMDVLSNQVKTIANGMKTSNMEVRQLINYGVNQNNVNKGEILKTVSASNQKIIDAITQNAGQMNRLASIMDDLRKTVEGELAGLNEGVMRLQQTEGVTATSVGKGMENIKEEMVNIMSDFNSKLNNTIKSGEKVDPGLLKEIKSMKKNMTNIMSDFDGGSTVTEAPATAPSPKILKSLDELKSNLDRKFEIITDVMKDLVQTNIEYVNYLKDPDDKAAVAPDIPKDTTSENK